MQVLVVSSHNPRLRVLAPLPEAIQAARETYPSARFVRKNKLLEPLNMLVYSDHLHVLTITQYVQTSTLQAA